MKDSQKIGFSFGITSGVITTLGLMVGLTMGTQSKTVIIGGILTIAIADAFSDALGVHVSEESHGQHTSRTVWESTVVTWLTKFFTALTFLLPVIFFEGTMAIIISVIWGFLILAVFSYQMAKQKGKNPQKVVTEHLLVGFVVVVITYFVGETIARFLK